MGRKKINVLITAASRRVALIRGFQNALKASGTPGEVIATDTDPLSPALFFCPRYHNTPLSNAPGYIPAIMDICKKEEIGLLIPTIDEELPLFGRHKKEFAAAGVTIPVVDEEIGEICNDKYKTYHFFKSHGLPMAETYLPDEVRQKKPVLPLFIKPRAGRGAVSAYPINSARELDFFLEYVHDPVVQRFLPGKEYTIDVLCDFAGRVISIVPRQRMVIRSGVCDKGRTEKHPALMRLAEEAACALKLIGPANLQCKMDGDTVTFFEVNPRFSGAIQLTINAGADFPRLILEMMHGDIPARIGDFEDNLTMVSYEESVYRAGGGWRR
ncbi:MAG: ATP-grasp domain-containing protein [Nitrospinae bacterium]|nr:ATP-grasp domain-containing protein [Nitrospinota bacterium]